MSNNNNMSLSASTEGCSSSSSSTTASGGALLLNHHAHPHPHAHAHPIYINHHGNHHVVNGMQLADSPSSEPSIISPPPPPPLANHLKMKPLFIRRSTTTSTTTTTPDASTTATTTTTTTKVISAKEQLLSFNRSKLVKTTTKVRTADGRVYQEQISGESVVTSYLGVDDSHKYKDYTTVTEISPHVYCNQLSKWIIFKTEPLIQQSQPQQQYLNNISIFSFNVWFDSYLWRERAAEMFGLIVSRMPDLVCLQEVTPMFLEYLIEQPWVRRHYLVSDCGHSDTVFPYGSVLLVKYNNGKGLCPYQLKSFTIYPLPTRQNRKMLTALIQLDSGALMSVSTVHLESLASSSNLRIQQLQTISNINQERQQKLQEVATFLVGDLNFGVNTPENNEMSKQSFSDLWTSINPDKQSAITCIKKQERVDRILLWRSQSQSQTSSTIDNSKSNYNIIGTVPMSIDENTRESENIDKNEMIYPSDHFGLYALFNF